MRHAKSVPITIGFTTKEFEQQTLTIDEIRFLAPFKVVYSLCTQKRQIFLPAYWMYLIMGINRQKIGAFKL
jgi:hypothetical protein